MKKTSAFKCGSPRVFAVALIFLASCKSRDSALEANASPEFEQVETESPNTNFDLEREWNAKYAGQEPLTVFRDTVEVYGANRNDNGSVSGEVMLRAKETNDPEKFPCTFVAGSHAYLRGETIVVDSPARAEFAPESNFEKLAVPFGRLEFQPNGKFETKKLASPEGNSGRVKFTLPMPSE